MGDRNLSLWVSDQLYALLGKPHFRRAGSASCNACALFVYVTELSPTVGYSEDALVSFILTLARKATSAAGLASKLQDQACKASGAIQLLVKSTELMRIMSCTSSCTLSFCFIPPQDFASIMAALSSTSDWNPFAAYRLLCCIPKCAWVLNDPGSQGWPHRCSKP